MTSITRPEWAHVPADLAGRTVAIVGGSGGVGEGVVRALISAGAHVIATGRNETRLVDLAGRIDSDLLHTAALDGLRSDLDDRVAGLAAQFGPFDAVVVSVASWGDQGRKGLLEIDDDEWNSLVEGNLTSVFRVYRAFVPTLAPTGMLLQLNGLSADMPFPGAAVVALGAAAAKSMTRTLAEELRETGPRVYELILGLVRTPARQLAGIDDARWIDGTDIGIHISELISGSSPLLGDVLHYFVDRAEGPTATAPEIR